MAGSCQTCGLLVGRLTTAFQPFAPTFGLHPSLPSGTHDLPRANSFLLNTFQPTPCVSQTGIQTAAGRPPHVEK